MVQVELCQLHVGSILAQLAEGYILTAMLSHVFQLTLNPLVGNLRISLLWCPTFWMNKGRIQRNVAEQVEQIVVVHGAIGTYLSLDEFAASHLLIGQNLVAGIHTGIVVVPVHLKVTDTRVELMLVQRNIKVAPADTDTVRNTPYVGTLIHDVGHAEPSPIHVAQTAVNGGNGGLEVGIRELVLLGSQTVVYRLVQICTSGNGQACSPYHSGNDDFVIYCFHCRICF